jgi:hypothetical protein
VRHVQIDTSTCYAAAPEALAQDPVVRGLPAICAGLPKCVQQGLLGCCASGSPNRDALPLSPTLLTTLHPFLNVRTQLGVCGARWAVRLPFLEALLLTGAWLWGFGQLLSKRAPSAGANQLPVCDN